ncbi:MAC/Perforin domain-containing protein [Actinidia rufa]|uniref:MAC/Perforin domain-containing protein n=1 Tax=Actinidia rufa TaxID=165716 RepID=A0A7J0FNS2_9ERIC|nr:MAC/Perforin domain-containing protein [Actinidia rufa]
MWETSHLLLTLLDSSPQTYPMHVPHPWIGMSISLIPSSKTNNHSLHSEPPSLPLQIDFIQQDLHNHSIEMSYDNGIVEEAIRSLGKGFDITSDFRLKYCKGNDGFVLLNETETRDRSVQGFGTFKHVSVDIKCDKGGPHPIPIQSDILDFKQMSEFFNRKCSVPGKIPSGLFNSMFGFESGSWSTDASNTHYLGLDGYFIILFSVHIDRYPLVLSDQVRNAVLSTWDPSALARFIEKYGTHIIVGLSVGGQDVVLVRQDSSSKSNDEASHLRPLG